MRGPRAATDVWRAKSRIRRSESTCQKPRINPSVSSFPPASFRWLYFVSLIAFPACLRPRCYGAISTRLSLFGSLSSTVVRNFSNSGFPRWLFRTRLRRFPFEMLLVLSAPRVLSKKIVAGPSPLVHQFYRLDLSLLVRDFLYMSPSPFSRSLLPLWCFLCGMEVARVHSLMLALGLLKVVSPLQIRFCAHFESATVVVDLSLLGFLLVTGPSAARRFASLVDDFAYLGSLTPLRSFVGLDSASSVYDLLRLGSFALLRRPWPAASLPGSDLPHLGSPLLSRSIAHLRSFMMVVGPDLAGSANNVPVRGSAHFGSSSIPSVTRPGLALRAVAVCHSFSLLSS